MSNKVLTGVQRKAALLDIGAKLAAKHGAINVTRRMVAKAAGVSEGLVSVHMGGTELAQKAYARKAKALGLTLPDKAKAEAIGTKLRAHGPRDARRSRVRSAKEVDAIKRKVVTKPANKTRAAKLAKPLVPEVKLPKPAVTKTPRKRVTKLPTPKVPPLVPIETKRFAPKLPPLSVPSSE